MWYINPVRYVMHPVYQWTRKKHLTRSDILFIVAAALFVLGALLGLGTLGVSGDVVLRVLERYTEK